MAHVKRTDGNQGPAHWDIKTNLPVKILQDTFFRTEIAALDSYGYQEGLCSSAGSASSVKTVSSVGGQNSNPCMAKE